MYKDGDKFIAQVKREMAWSTWFQMLKSSSLYGNREDLRKLVETLTISKN